MWYDNDSVCNKDTNDETTISTHPNTYFETRSSEEFLVKADNTDPQMLQSIRVKRCFQMGSEIYRACFALLRKYKPSCTGKAG